MRDPILQDPILRMAAAHSLRRSGPHPIKSCDFTPEVALSLIN